MAKKSKNISRDEFLTDLITEGNAEVEDDGFKARLATDDLDFDLDLRDAISTDIPILDFWMGGGLYPGRIYEIFGEESHGKSTLAYHWMARIEQDRDGLIILAESETALDKDRAHLIGADPSQFIIFTPEHVEDCFERIAKYLRRIREKQQLIEGNNNFPVGIFWDTIASAPTKTEVDFAEGKTDNKFGGGKQEKPRLIREWLRSHNKVLPKSNALLVLVNQVYEQNDKWGNQQLISPGGRGIRHHASGRIFVNRGRPIVDEQDRQVGFTVNMKIVKCKQAPSDGKELKCDLYFSTGYDPLSSIVHYVVDKSLIEKRGSWLVVRVGKDEEIKEQGVQNLTQRMKSDDRVRKILTYKAATDIANLSPVIRKRFYNQLVALAEEVGETPPLHEKWDLYAREFKLHMSKTHRRFIAIEDCLDFVLSHKKALDNGELDTTQKRNKYLEDHYS